MTNQKKTQSPEKETAVDKAKAAPTADAAQLKVWSNTVATFIGDFTKLTNDRLSKALAASLNHFENVGSHSATELGKLYLCLRQNGGKSMAAMVALIASKGYAIKLTYDEDSGTVKYGYKVRAYNAIGESKRSEIMAMLGEGKIAALYTEFKKADKEEKDEPLVRSKCEAITKRFEKALSEIKELSENTTDTSDLGTIWAALHEHKKMVAALEELLDKAKKGIGSQLESEAA